jgi:putative acetyltransferase
MIIRDELIGDAEEIERIVRDAFCGAQHSSGTETAIIAALRSANELTLSLVATDECKPVGYLAASPVSGLSGLSRECLNSKP